MFTLMLSLEYASNFYTVCKNNIKLCLKHFCKHFTPSTGNLAEEKFCVFSEISSLVIWVPIVHLKLNPVTF
jgi:hypothetical protein